MKVEQVDIRLTGYDFLQGKQTQKRIEENQKVKNDYFQRSNEYQGEDIFGYRLDLSYLLGSKDGFLSGSLSDEQDVDYYRFSIASFRNLNLVEKYNKDIVLHLDNLPADCQYEMVLYDQEGNQVGIAQDNGRGGKSVLIPNWDNSTEFTIKVFTMDKADSEKNYHLSFETMAAQEDSGACLQNQERAELLDRYARGEELSKEEKQSLMVYADAYEWDQAKAIRELNQKILPAIKAGLENITLEKVQLTIQVKSDGQVAVKGAAGYGGKDGQPGRKFDLSGICRKNQGSEAGADE